MRTELYLFFNQAKREEKLNHRFFSLSFSLGVVSKPEGKVEKNGERNFGPGGRQRANE